ncbi:MAG: hypothetical protein ABIB79_01750 [archaeon]
MQQQEVKPQGKTKLKVSLIILLVLISALIVLAMVYLLFNLETNPTTCGDRTPFNQCSSIKPYSCSNGVLIPKASQCGCPSGLTQQENSCYSEYQTNPKTINLKYILRGKENYIPFTVYEGLANYMSNLSRIISGSGESPTRQDFKLKAIDDPIQRQYLLPLITEIQNRASDKTDQARIAISLVQNIPFESSDKKVHLIFKDIAYSRYPYEVLYEMKGVCGEKTELLAFILRELGYDTVFFYHQEENHESLGIKCPIQYSLDNSGYCFVETTGSSIITDNEIKYIRDITLDSQPEIIPVSEGDPLPADMYEYKDAETWKALRIKVDEEGGLYFYEVVRKNLIRNKYGLVEVYYG